MKRDMELVVKILEHLEERDDTSVIEDLSIPDYDDDVVAYQCHRMYEAGLLDAEVERSASTHSRLVKVYPFGLTWDGHEFLDAMRSKTVRAEVRKRLGGELVDAPFVLIKELALAIARANLGLG